MNLIAWFFIGLLGMAAYQFLDDITDIQKRLRKLESDNVEKKE